MSLKKVFVLIINACKHQRQYKQDLYYIEHVPENARVHYINFICSEPHEYETYTSIEELYKNKKHELYLYVFMYNVDINALGVLFNKYMHRLILPNGKLFFTYNMEIQNAIQHSIHTFKQYRALRALFHERLKGTHVVYTKRLVLDETVSHVPIISTETPTPRKKPDKRHKRVQVNGWVVVWEEPGFIEGEILHLTKEQKKENRKRKDQVTDPVLSTIREEDEEEEDTTKPKETGHDAAAAAAVAAAKAAERERERLDIMESIRKTIMEGRTASVTTASLLDRGREREREREDIFSVPLSKGRGREPEEEGQHDPKPSSTHKGRKGTVNAFGHLFKSSNIYLHIINDWLTAPVVDVVVNAATTTGSPFDSGSGTVKGIREYLFRAKTIGGTLKHASSEHARQYKILTDDYTPKWVQNQSKNTAGTASFTIHQGVPYKFRLDKREFYIIHAAGPAGAGDKHAKPRLQSAYTAVFNLLDTDSLNISSAAVPLIGTGVYSVDPAVCLEALYRAVLSVQLRRQIHVYVTIPSATLTQQMIDTLKSLLRKQQHGSVGSTHTHSSVVFDDVQDEHVQALQLDQEGIDNIKFLHLEHVEIRADGNCLFYSIAHCILNLYTGDYTFQDERFSYASRSTKNEIKNQVHKFGKLLRDYSVSMYLEIINDYNQKTFEEILEDPKYTSLIVTIVLDMRQDKEPQTVHDICDALHAYYNIMRDERRLEFGSQLDIYILERALNINMFIIQYSIHHVTKEKYWNVKSNTTFISTQKSIFLHYNGTNHYSSLVPMRRTLRRYTTEDILHHFDELYRQGVIVLDYGGATTDTRRPSAPRLKQSEIEKINEHEHEALEEQQRKHDLLVRLYDETLFLTYVQIPGKGNCMFQSIAECLLHLPPRHGRDEMYRPFYLNGNRYQLVQHNSKQNKKTIRDFTCQL